MVKLWMRWCRLCAKEDLSNTHINVFLKDEEGLQLSETINKCFSIDINHFNDWPHMICIQCYHLAKSIIKLAERTPKVHAMFSELLDCEEEMDANELKIRYELHKFSDVKFAVSNFELADINLPIEMTEQMVDVDELQYIDSDMLNPSAIKTEKGEEDYLNQIDEMRSPDNESSDSNSSFKSEAKSVDDEKPKKRPNRKSSTEPIKCEKCNKCFLRVQNHRRHMLNAHNINIEQKPLNFVCEECGRKCKSLWALKDHQLRHTEERAFQCKSCDKQFKTKQTLKIHEDIHKETNYICVVCGLKLNTRRTLRMHMVVHSEKKQHKCDYCGNEYKRAKALKNHLILHTGLKPYTCDFCEKTFANGSNCRSHKKKAHPVELAAMEAAGKNSKAACIPKLEHLRAVTSNKLEGMQISDLTRKVNNGPESEIQESLEEQKPLLSNNALLSLEEQKPLLSNNALSDQRMNFGQDIFKSLPES